MHSYTSLPTTFQTLKFGQLSEQVMAGLPKNTPQDPGTLKVLNATTLSVPGMPTSNA